MSSILGIPNPLTIKINYPVNKLQGIVRGLNQDAIDCGDRKIFKNMPVELEGLIANIVNQVTCHLGKTFNLYYGGMDTNPHLQGAVNLDLENDGSPVAVDYMRNDYDTSDAKIPALASYYRETSDIDEYALDEDDDGRLFCNWDEEYKKGDVLQVIIGKPEGVNPYPELPFIAFEASLKAGGNVAALLNLSLKLGDSTFEYDPEYAEKPDGNQLIHSEPIDMSTVSLTQV